MPEIISIEYLRKAFPEMSEEKLIEMYNVLNAGEEPAPTEPTGSPIPSPVASFTGAAIGRAAPTLVEPLLRRTLGELLGEGQTETTRERFNRWRRTPKPGMYE